MNDINALRWSHLLGSVAWGLSLGTLVVYAQRAEGSWALLTLAIFLPAVALAALTWNEMVKEEYRDGTHQRA